MLQPERVGDFNRVCAYNEGLVVYIYDDSQIEAWQRLSGSEQVRRYSLSDREFATGFAPSDMLAYELRQDDEVRLDIAVRPPLTDEETALLCVREPQTGLLRLPTGRLCVECANNVRFNPDYFESEMDEDERGTLIEVPPGDYRVWLYHVDFEALPTDELRDYRGPCQVVTLEPAKAHGAASPAGNFLPFPCGKQARLAKQLDKSWAGRYTLENGAFQGQFVHNYDVSGPCINFDRVAADALGLKIGDRLAVEFDEAHIKALFLGDAVGRDPAAAEFAAAPNHTKCCFVIDRERVEKLMLFQFPDRDMMHLDFRKTPLFGTPVRIRRLD